MSAIGNDLVDAMGEMLADLRGEAPQMVEHHVAVSDVDVRAIREGLGLKRPEFCRRFGLDVRAVQDWEQKRRRPDKAARSLLLVIKSSPAAVESAVAAEFPHA